MSRVFGEVDEDLQVVLKRHVLRRGEHVVPFMTSAQILDQADALVEWSAGLHLPNLLRRILHDRSEVVEHGEAIAVGNDGFDAINGENQEIHFGEISTEGQAHAEYLHPQNGNQ